MNTIEIRQASHEDVPTLIKLRWEIFVEHGVTDGQNELIRRRYERTFREFLDQHLDQSQCQFWVALAEGQIIATATLWLFPILPWPGNLNEWHGQISNLYTVPSYRRLGIARQMLETLRQVAEQAHVTSLLVEQPSSLTSPLYSSLGYKPASYVNLKLD